MAAKVGCAMLLEECAPFVDTKETLKAQKEPLKKPAKQRIKDILAVHFQSKLQPSIK